MVPPQYSYLYNIQDSFGNEVLSFSELEGAIPCERIIYQNGEPRTYEYLHQTEDGTCAPATFYNLFSFIHGKPPGKETLKKEIYEGKLNKGTYSSEWIYFFSLIHGNNNNNKDFIFRISKFSPEERYSKANDLIDFLDNIEDGSMICGMKEHCNAIHRYGNSGQYILVEPNNVDGLEVMTRDGVVRYLVPRFTDNKFKDVFYFIGPEINPDLYKK